MITPYSSLSKTTYKGCTYHKTNNGYVLDLREMPSQHYRNARDYLDFTPGTHVTFGNEDGLLWDDFVWLFNSSVEIELLIDSITATLQNNINQ